MGNFVIGVDGGGTETVLIISDVKGRIHKRYRGSACNYQILGRERFKEILGNFINESIKNADIPQEAVAHLCLGLAGVGREEDQREAVKLFGEMGWDDRVSAESDALIALEGAFAGDVGIILISGSGSICVGKNQKGEVIRAGGWGYLLGDEGSGYDLGRKALRAALQTFDGRGPQTLLLEKIRVKFKLNSIDKIVPKIYSGEIDKEKIAALAPLVFDAAAMGDRVAQKIIAEAGRNLGQLAVAVACRLHLKGKKVRVALSGGVFRRKEMLIERMKKELRSVSTHIEFVSPHYEPAVGAVILALRKISVAINDEILRNLRAMASH